MNQPCDYCGLPAPIRGQEAPAATVFCCLGCRIAAGIMQDDGQSEWTITRLGIAIFFTMNVMVFTLVLWTWNVHAIEPDARIVAFRGVLRYACLLFSTPVLILLGGPLVESAIQACQERRLTTDVLLLLGVIASFAYSIAALFLDSQDVYFEICCMILVAVTLGKWLEGTAKQRATKAIRSLRELLPQNVRLQRGPSEQLVSIEEVCVGDRIRVLPGERVPLDGAVENMCVVDEQLISGESIPVTKRVADVVYAGSLNQSQLMELRVTSPANEGTITRLMNVVEEATSASCKSIRLADRLSTWFVPVIVVASVVTFGLHSHEGFQHALMAAVSVVLIACPCALGIATPLALWVAINSAAAQGVLFRSGDAVMDLAKLRSLGLDKTGTVTSGDVRVVEVKRDPSSRTTSTEFIGRDESRELEAVSLSLASLSSHPLATAIADGLAGAEELTTIDAEDHSGKGVTATLSLGDVPTQAMLGSREFAEELGFEVPQGLVDATCAEEFAVVCVGWNRKVQAVFWLQDTIRCDSLNTMQQLRRLGLSLKILTGDTAPRAAAMQKATGVLTMGTLLPEDKARELGAMRAPVGMVGDGLNDAIALSVADVGIAMDCGADVSRESADVCLLGNTLARLPWTIRLARATQRTVRRNLVWAVGYNAVGIGFAMTGKLNPIVAAVAMVGSSLFVLTSSLALGVAYGSDDRSSRLGVAEGPEMTKREQNSTRAPELVA